MQRPGDGQAALRALRVRMIGVLEMIAKAPLPDAAARLIEVTPALKPETTGRLAERGTERRQDGVHWRWDRRLRALGGIGFPGTIVNPMHALAMPHALVFGRHGDLLDATDGRAACSEHLVEIAILPGGHALHLETPEQHGRIIAGLGGR